MLPSLLVVFIQKSKGSIISACPGSSVGERCPEEAVVPGSNPGLGTIKTKTENISSVAVITGRCQRSNPGSNPGWCITFLVILISKTFFVIRNMIQTPYRARGLDGYDVALTWRRS